MPPKVAAPPQTTVAPKTVETQPPVIPVIGTAAPVAPPVLSKTWTPKAAAASIASPSVTSDVAVATGLRALANAGTVLKPGDQGPAVIELQTALKKLGYTVKVDGQLGPGTAAQLNDFARTNGLKGNGTGTLEIERALSMRVDRNNFAGAVSRLCKTFSQANNPRFVETTQATFRQIEAEPDAKKRAAMVGAFFTQINTLSESKSKELDLKSATWRADLQAVEAHVNDAENVPSQTHSELQFARTTFTNAARDQFASDVRLTSDAVRAQNPSDPVQFIDVVNKLETSDAKDADVQKTLADFFAQHGLKEDKLTDPNVRAAWDRMNAMVIDSQRTGSFKALADFTQQTFMRHTIDAIQADPKNPADVQLSNDLKTRLAALEAAAAKNNAGALTGDALRSIVPTLTPAYAAELATAMQTAMDVAGIKTPRERAAFIAQCAHETMDFKSFHELGNNAYFDKYDNRTDLGNRGHPDGATYKGRGALQLTGRANYQAYSKWETQQPSTPGSAPITDASLYVKHPEMLENPGPAFRSAAFYWKTHHLNAAADQNNFKLVTQRINGGTNGWADRVALYTRALTALGAPA